MNTKIEAEVLGQLFGVENFVGIDRELVQETFPEQVKSGKPFVVAITQETDWANGESGVQIMYAQNREGLSSSDYSLATMLLNNWSNKTLIFGFQNAKSDGLIANDETMIGRYVDDILKEKGYKYVSRLVVLDSTTPITYRKKDGTMAEVKPRQSTKGELLANEDGEAVYRRVELSFANNISQLPPDNVIPAKVAWNNNSIGDLLGSSTIE